MKNLIGQPVEAIRAGEDDKTLFLTKFTQENTKTTDADHLVERSDRYFLCVQHPIRFKNLIGSFGKVSPAKLYEKSGDETYRDIEVDFLRNHPIQYAGLVFQTESGSEYGITPDYRFMALTKGSSINGAKIKNIAGLDNTSEMHLSAKGYLSEDGKNITQNFIFEEGKAIMPGRFLIIALTDEESIIRGKKGCKTSPIERIRPATLEELARYKQ